MFAQAYFDGELTVRVFDRDGKMIADLPMASPPCEKTADDALKTLRLKRRAKWDDAVGWPGRQAKVRFA